MLDTLFNQTRQNILSVLLLSPERRWYLSDLAKHLKVQPSSLQRELVSLTDGDILVREIDGNRVYYRANSSHPLMPELQNIFAKTVGLADQVKSVLMPFWDRIDFSFIFGSVARGERSANSDVDLLIVGTVGMPEIALSLRDLERYLQIPINVVHYTMAEFQDGVSRNNHFLKTILPGQKIFLKGSEHELADIAGSPAAKNAYNE